MLDSQSHEFEIGSHKHLNQSVNYIASFVHYNPFFCLCTCSNSHRIFIYFLECFIHSFVHSFFPSFIHPSIHPSYMPPMSPRGDSFATDWLQPKVFGVNVFKICKLVGIALWAKPVPFLCTCYIIIHMEGRHLGLWYCNCVYVDFHPYCRCCCRYLMAARWLRKFIPWKSLHRTMSTTSYRSLLIQTSLS